MLLQMIGEETYLVEAQPLLLTRVKSLGSDEPKVKGGCYLLAV